jgi:hypothetical protein
MGRVLFIQWKVDKGFRISIVSSGVEKHECHNLERTRNPQERCYEQGAVEAVALGFTRLVEGKVSLPPIIRVDVEICVTQMASLFKHANNNLDTSTCPLCGEPNQCALAADHNATECWCESVDFPDGLLAQIPDEAVRKTCVCQKCLNKYQESISSTNKSS